MIFRKWDIRYVAIPPCNVSPQTENNSPGSTFLEEEKCARRYTHWRTEYKPYCHKILPSEHDSERTPHPFELSQT